MGMVLGLTTLSDENIERILADPPLVWRVVAPDDPEIYAEARREQLKPSLLSRFFGKKTDQLPPPEQLWLGEAEAIATDLDKAWHGIHYLLTGTADEGDMPLSFLMSGGRIVGDIEVGYGPARVFTSAETQAIADALAPLSEDELRARFDPDDMMSREIYPEIWSRRPPEDDPIGYLVEHFRLLRGFLQQTTESGVGIVVTLS